MSTTFAADDPLALFSGPAPVTTAPAPTPTPTPPVNIQAAVDPTPVPVATAPPVVSAPAQSPFTSLDQLAQQPAGAGAPAIIQRQNAVTMSLDSEQTVSSGRLEFFKARKDWKERIGILAPTKIYGGRTHYIESPADKKGRYFCSSEFMPGPGGQEVCTKVAPCCERLEPARFRFSAMIIHYLTQQNGNIAEPFTFKLKIWQFTDILFTELQGTNREWKLSEHDLLIKLDGDEKYQKVKYDVTKECIYRRADFLQKYGPTVHAWATTTLPSLDKTIGKRIQPHEWLPLLTGQTAGVGTVVDQRVEDISDVLSRGL